MINRFLNHSLLFAAALLFCNCQKKAEKKAGETLFEKLSPGKTGLQFENRLLETDSFNVLAYAYFFNGGGAAAGDLDGDDLPDVVLTSNMGQNQIFKNKGNFQFENMTERAGIAREGGWSSGVALADVNADGRLDIYICRTALADPAKRRNLLFINQGDFKFEEKGRQFGLGEQPRWTTHAIFFDFDRDGDLDLFEINHSTNEFSKMGLGNASARAMSRPDIGNRLFENQNGHFKDVSERAGIRSNVLTFSLGAAASDLTGDGWPDIYVGNDFNEHDYFYENQRDGTFKETSKSRFETVPHFTMGIDVADFNNDLLPDLVALDMLPSDRQSQQLAFGPDNYDKFQLLYEAGFQPQTMRNMLQLNRGDGTFAEIGQLAGIEATYWSWAPLFADFDNDGWKDLFVTNGYQRDYTNMEVLAFSQDNEAKMRNQDWKIGLRELLKKMPAIDAPNFMFKNRGDLTFENVAENWGLAQKDLSNGAAWADFDRDGDLDLLVNNVNAPADLFKNRSTEISGGGFLEIRFDDLAKSVGARAILETADGSRQLAELQPSRGFQSSVEPILHFGFGQKALKKLTVEWPDGAVQIFENENLKPNSFLKISKNGASPKTKMPPPENLKTIFKIEKTGLGDAANFVQKENYAQDFKVDFLLPWMLSALGPKLAKADANGDGLEDLWVGGAHESAAQLFFQEKNGTFRRSKQPDFELDADAEDLEAAFFDADADGDQDLFVASGGNEFEDGAEQTRPRFYQNDGRGNFRRVPTALPDIRVSAQAVAVADFDRDGDTDVFLGGRLRAGFWPMPPRSFLLKNDGHGQFSETTPPDLHTPGMVSAAEWADFDGDGWPELCLAGEWMAVQVFKNEKGALKKQAVAGSEGLWQCLKITDLDNDGDLDFAAGNLGENGPFQASENEPIAVTAADFDGNGSLDPILTHFIGGKSWPMPSRDDLLGQIPSLKKQFLHYDDYARASLADIFDAKKLETAFKVRAVRTATTVFENDGKGQFSIKNLPIEAQFAPVFAIETGDFNADGLSDLVLAGNLERARARFGHLSASNGLVLLGQKTGGFRAVSSPEAGLNLTGEVRDVLKIKSSGAEKWVFARNGNGLVFAKN